MKKFPKISINYQGTPAGPYTLRLVREQAQVSGLEFGASTQQSAATAAAGEVEKYSANAIGDGVIASLSWEWRKEGGRGGRQTEA